MFPEFPFSRRTNRASGKMPLIWQGIDEVPPCVAMGRQDCYPLSRSLTMFSGFMYYPWMWHISWAPADSTGLA
jgi:hypothetical protein